MLDWGHLQQHRVFTASRAAFKASFLQQRSFETDHLQHQLLPAHLQQQKRKQKRKQEHMQKQKAEQKQEQRQKQKRKQKQKQEEMQKQKQKRNKVEARVNAKAEAERAGSKAKAEATAEAEAKANAGKEQTHVKQILQKAKEFPKENEKTILWSLGGGAAAGCRGQMWRRVETVSMSS